MTASQEHTAKVEQLYRNLGQTAQQIQGRVVELGAQLKQMEEATTKAAAGIASRPVVGATATQREQMQQGNIKESTNGGNSRG